SSFRVANLLDSRLNRGHTVPTRVHHLSTYCVEASSNTDHLALLKTFYRELFNSEQEDAPACVGHCDNVLAVDFVIFRVLDSSDFTACTPLVYLRRGHYRILFLLHAFVFVCRSQYSLH